MGQAQAQPEKQVKDLKIATGMDVEEVVAALYDYSDGRHKIIVSKVDHDRNEVYLSTRRK